MNDLTWFLYLVDVSQNIPPLIGISTLPLLIAAFIVPPKGVAMFSYDHDYPFQGLGRLKNWFIAWFFAVVFACLIPTTETMYMMAASEAGETTLKSPQGQQVLDKINLIINNQLDQLAKKKEQ
jgi:hypothetical protein